MFTGIITDIGEIAAVEPFGNGMRLSITCSYAPSTIDLGASIACAGVCLTVTSVAERAKGAHFTVDASTETMDKTTIGNWIPGTRINLERALKMGDELGGHLVSGHVDGVARVVERHDEEAMRVLRIQPARALRGFIATKGSVTLDGTSLTVNEADETFTVALIAHTLTVTTWGDRRPGDLVNLEVDMLARYVARIVQVQLPSG